MKKLTSLELKQMYLEFFKSKGHSVISSASLIPENDPTVLFTTAGMHPLVPYLLGEKHPQGKRLTDVQKCVRTGDIDEVGDNTHCTFFEMLGNWSLGDYFKEDAVKFSYEFLTSPDYLNIPVQKLAVTCFEGDENAPRDEESARIWESLGLPKDKIFFLDKSSNWWGPAGVTGPCGPDTEMFIDTGKDKCCEACNPSCDCGKYIEIWNDVFMEYFKNPDGTFSPLEHKNVDTGMGVERAICTLNGINTVYSTDIYEEAIAHLEKVTGKKISDKTYEKAFRIVLDHVRASTFIIGDIRGVTPSNVDQGYVLRRLIRRAIRFGRQIDMEKGTISRLAEIFIKNYSSFYEELAENKNKILAELEQEEERFSKTIEQGLKEFEKVSFHIKSDVIPGKTAFRLYDTFGFPLEMTVELATEKGMKVDVEGYELAFKEHQKKSQAGSEQRFKGGLSDSTEETTKLHTATHLLHKALKIVLKRDDVNQKGSNITPERLRFDFAFDRPMTKEEISQVEDWVNNAIAKEAPVTMKEMTVTEAKESGAIGLFTSKYGEKVKVYEIDGLTKEICGGPHVGNTKELGVFKIKKEQSSSSGVRRIKAVLESQN